MASSIATRVGTLLLALVAGAIFGSVGTVSHSFTVVLGPVTLPVGLALALIGAGALLVGIRAIADRWATLAAGLGLFVIVAAFAGVGPGGSVLVPDTWMGVGWTFSAPLLTAIVVAWPDLRGRGRGPRAEPRAN